MSTHHLARNPWRTLYEALCHHNPPDPLHTVHNCPPRIPTKLWHLNLRIVSIVFLELPWFLNVFPKMCTSTELLQGSQKRLYQEPKELNWSSSITTRSPLILQSSAIRGSEFLSGDVGRINVFMPGRRVELERRLQGEVTMSEERKQRQLQQLGKKESTYLRLRRTKLGLDDFKTVKVIGKGAFGEASIVVVF